jgi:hypothetical protein
MPRSARSSTFRPTLSAHRRPLVRAAILFTALGASAGAAWGQTSPALDRFSFSAGGFYAEPKIKLGADTRYGRIDTPDDKQSHVTIPRVKADLLFGESQGLSFDYYRYDKSYNPTISGTTEYQGQTATGTATVDGKLRLDLAQLAYKWWIGKGNDVFGIGAGAAYYRAEVSGTANGSVQSILGSQTGTASDKASDDAFAPLLELGYRHAFTPDLRMYVDASGIKKNGGRINGHIYSAAVGVEWFPWKNVGLVADYGISKIQLNRDSERSADINVRLTGPSAYLKVRF